MDQKLPANFVSVLARHPFLGNLLLAFLYCLTGHIGLALAAAPNFATAVWPASGIALAWILLFGWRFLFGVVLGSFIVNLVETSKALEIDIIQVNPLIPLLVGIGAACQAGLGAWLIKRYANYPNALDSPLSVFKLLGLGGIIATLFNATWAVSILYWGNVIHANLFAQSWFVWWVGDSIGVLVFAPVLLALGLAPPFFNKTRAILITFVSMTTFALAALIFLLAVELEHKDRLAEFKARTQQVMQQLQQRLQEYESFALFAQGFFAGSEFVSQEEFYRFSKSWLQKHDEVQAVEWAPKILFTERQQWEQQQSQLLQQSVLITERGGTQRDILLTVARDREVYFPILYIEPWQNNRMMLGFDTQTNEGSIALITRMATNEQPLLSSPLKLIQSAKKESGVLLYAPIFTPNMTRNFANLKGVLIVVLKNESVLAKLHQEVIGQSFLLWVRDKQTGQTIYGIEPNNNYLKRVTPLEMYYRSEVTFGQRVWAVDIWPSEQKLASYQSWLTWLVLVVGLLSTSLAVSYTLISTGYRQSLEKAVKRHTDTLVNQNRQLELARQEADQANVAKSLFLANMSHEIRTPMNGVLGMTELLRDTHLSVQQQQYLQVIYASGKAMLSIINDILDYSKIEAGKMEVEQIDVDLGEVLLECSSIFYLVAEQKGIDLVVNIEANTPTLVQTDPTRLKQILLNLLSNAFKFTTYGQVALRIYQQHRQDTWLYIEVSDTGIGISAEQQQGLFNAFKQVNVSTTRQFGGTGLGLSISKQLAELMNGQIVVESELNQGSKFTIALPYVMATEKFKEEHRQATSLLKGLRVLLVDDNNDFGRHIVQQAELWGIHIDIIHDGEYALLLLKRAIQGQRPYHVIVLNIQQTTISIATLAQQLKQSDELKQLKRILVSSATTQPNDQQLAQLAIDAVMQKPHSFIPMRDAILGVMPVEQIEMSLSVVGSSILANKHVLLAEDYMVNQMVIVAMLQKMHITVDVVSNGKEALTAYRQQPQTYALILMDCEMPEQDGYVTTQLIRQFEQQQQLKAIPIVALTAYVKAEQYKHCLEVGMNDFLSKPLTAQTLKACLLKNIGVDKTA